MGYNKLVNKGSLLSVVVSILITIPVLSQEAKYVAASGNDTANNCSDAENPCATIQYAIDQAVAGDSIIVASGSYAESVVISTPNIVLAGPQLGVDARNRSGSESTLTGSIRVTANADTLVIDGFRITEGETVQGSDVAVYIEAGAVGVSIKNSIFFRSGDVDSDNYRGILTVSGGNQTGLTIQNNSFSGWNTGVYLNPAATGVQVLNNAFDENYVGMSIDAPINATISGNSFSENVFEAIGIGGGVENPSATITGNSFSENTMHLGIYSGEGTLFDFSQNTFDDVSAAEMTINQLLSLEAKIGHGVDGSGGYSGFARLKNNAVFVTSGNSIDTAADLATENDTVYVASGTYSEEVSVSTSKITILGEEGATLTIGSGQTGFTISGDSVTISNMEIVGPYSDDYTTVDWDLLANAFGISITGTASGVVISNNEISDTRTGISFLSGSSGTASGNIIDNTKGSFLIRTDNATLTGNSYGDIGNEWDIIFLSVSDGAYVTSPTVDAEAYSSEIMALSKANGGMTVLDRRYGINGLLGLASGVGNRSHVSVKAGANFTIADDFGIGNGLGNPNQPYGNIQDGISAIVIGGVVTVASGTYEESLNINKTGISIIGSGVDESIIDHSGKTPQNNAGVYVSANKVSLKGFTITGDSLDSTPRYGLKVGTNSATTDSVVFENLKVQKSYRTGFDIARAKDISIKNVQAINNGGAGFFLVNTEGATLENITTNGNPWAGVSVANRDDWDGAASNIVFKGTNSFAESGSDNGSIQLEMTEAKPISWSTDAEDSKNVTLQSADVSYVISGPTTNSFDPGNGGAVSVYTPYFRFYKTLGEAQSAALGSPDHVEANNRYIRTANSSDNASNTVFEVYADEANKMSVQAAINQAVEGNTINVHAGTFSEEAIEVSVENLSLDFSAGIAGIDSVKLADSILKLSLAGDDSSRVILGNAEDNIFTISGGNNFIDGVNGENTIVLEGNRNNYVPTEKDNGSLIITDNRSGAPNGENTLKNIDLAKFDDITISLQFGEPVSYPGGSIAFSDDASTIKISNDDVFDLADSLSIEFWVKLNAFTSEYQTLLAKGSDAWSIHRYSNNNSLAFTTHGTGGEHTLQGSKAINDNQWHHVTAVFDGTKKLLYIDGILDAESDLAGTLAINDEAIEIGGWTGNVDELRIWNTARSAEAIRTNIFQQLKSDESGLIGYWRMDEGSGSRIADFTSNNNDASISALANIDWSNDNYPNGTFITGNAGWRVMSSSVNGATYKQLLEDIWTQGFEGADEEGGAPNVLVYTEGNGATDASERGFKAISSANDIPAKGQGFLVYVYEDDDPATDGVQGGFPKSLKNDMAQNSGSVSAPLSLTLSGEGGTYDSENDGWNMVGNPYSATINWDVNEGWSRSGIDNVVYVWSDSANNGTGAYLSWNGLTGTYGHGKIAPMQGFWVKANNTGVPSLAINDTARSSGAVLLKQRVIPQIDFTLSGNELSNRAILMFAEEANHGKDRFDAYKLASNNANWLSLSTSIPKQDLGAMDVQALPLNFEEDIELNLGIDGSATNGSFVLKWNAQDLPKDWSIYLIDTVEKISINLQKQEHYAFNLEGSTMKQKPELPQSLLPKPKVIKNSSIQRFKLVVASSDVTSNNWFGDLPENIQLSQNYPNPFNPTTIISYALPQTSNVTLEVFDLLGRKVATLINKEVKQAGNNTVNFSAGALSSGVYLYRLEVEGEVLIKKMTLIK